MNTFGVNVHFNQNNYNNTQAIADALNIIGFSRVRSRCVNMAEVAAWKDLANKTSPYFSQGLKANVLVEGYMNTRDSITFDSQLVGAQATIPQIAGIIESIEGPNEINNHAVGEGTHGPFDQIGKTSSYAANSLAWAQALYRWRSSTRSLSHVKLIAPNIASGDPNDYAKLPDLSQYVDSGNYHFYAGNGRQPSGFGGGNFSAIYDWYKAAASPTKPVSITEWGQTTAGKPEQGGCDNATQAKYILNQMFDIAAKNNYRAYLYQLMDSTPDGDPTGTDGTESHFGIFDYQWRVKPAAQALANVKNLLADTTTKFTARTPVYKVDGVKNAGAAGSSLSISKSDGSTFIVVWNEPKIWDQSANSPVTPPTNVVTIRFGGNYSYKVYDPLLGTNATASGYASSVNVNILGSPIMIQLKPTQCQYLRPAAFSPGSAIYST